MRLDLLAENNTAIVTLIKAYSPHAKTRAFIVEADKFRNYASAWRDRWNSVMELFIAGGNYATSEVPFPKGFPEVVQAEIERVCLGDDVVRAGRVIRERLGPPLFASTTHHEHVTTRAVAACTLGFCQTGHINCIN